MDMLKLLGKYHISTTLVTISIKYNLIQMYLYLNYFLGIYVLQEVILSNVVQIILNQKLLPLKIIKKKYYQYLPN